MSHSRRIAAAVLVAGVVFGAGALPASATDRGCDRGYHNGYHHDHARDGLCRDGWRHDGGHRYGHDRDDFPRGDGWRHDRGHRYGHDRDDFRRDGWLRHHDDGR